ncbi:MAG: DUF7482 domain-containing protein [Gaiellales bacterium]
MAVVSSIPNMGMGMPVSSSLASFQGFYDGHLDTYLTTDASTKMLAHQLGQGVNAAPVLSRTLGPATPREFYVLGRRVADQPVVFGSEPGESDYSPLWLVVTVHWKPGVKPVMLLRDDQIDALAKAGKLTETTTPWVINSPITSVTKTTTPPKTADGTLFGQGQPVMHPTPTLSAYYDGHKDAYIVTDVSSHAQASQLSTLKVNAAPAMAKVPAVAAPRMFFIEGKAVSQQIPVLGSEPGEADYSPLWTEVIVRWKPGVKPVMLRKDDQIDALAKAGKLTETKTTIIINAPVTHVT